MSLGDRMKGYEQQYQRYLDSNLPAVIRLDGHGFSKYVSLHNIVKSPTLKSSQIHKSGLPVLYIR